MIELPCLSAVYANCCFLNELSTEFVFKDSLEKVYLSRTIIIGVPSEALSQGYDDNCLERLRAHFKDLQAGEETLRACKLMVLGNGASWENADLPDVAGRVV